MQRPERAFARRGDHVVELPGAARVVRDRGEVVAVGLAQRIERGVVQVATLASEEVGLDRFACQRVPEREDVGLGFDQQAARRRDGAGSGSARVGVARDRGEQVEVDARDAEHRGGFEHAALLGAQVVELRAHQLGEAPRQLLAQERVGIVLAAAAARSSSRKNGLPPVRRVQRLDDPVRRLASVDRRRGTTRPRASRGDRGGGA